MRVSNLLKLRFSFRLARFEKFLIPGVVNNLGWAVKKIE